MFFCVAAQPCVSASFTKDPMLLATSSLPKALESFCKSFTILMQKEASSWQLAAFSWGRFPPFFVNPSIWLIVMEDSNHINSKQLLNVKHIVLYGVYEYIMYIHLNKHVNYLLEETHHLMSPIISHRLSPGSAKIHQASFGQTLSFQQINQLQTQWRWLQAYRNLDDSCSSKKISWIKPGHGKKKLLTRKKRQHNSTQWQKEKKKTQPNPFLVPGKKKQKHKQLPLTPPILQKKPSPFTHPYLSQAPTISSSRREMEVSTHNAFDFEPPHHPTIDLPMAMVARSARHSWYLPPLFQTGTLIEIAWRESTDLWNHSILFLVGFSGVFDQQIQVSSEKYGW